MRDEITPNSSRNYFVLQSETKRSLTAQKRGRPRKAAADERQSAMEFNP